MGSLFVNLFVAVVLLRSMQKDVVCSVIIVLSSVAPGLIPVRQYRVSKRKITKKGDSVPAFAAILEARQEYLLTNSAVLSMTIGVAISAKRISA